MSSGFGLNGGRGRCFPFWQDFAKCYVQTDAPKEDCRLQFEDYQECLYHRKEVRRTFASWGGSRRWGRACWEQRPDGMPCCKSGRQGI
ncbi:hypothetical protein BDZ88DRAFT_399429 [Geranomyces variabilis]|nr:hypothetical protein BDZ88DRAFT_399429 [Geranomyces variabilis]